MTPRVPSARSASLLRSWLGSDSELSPAEAAAYRAHQLEVGASNWRWLCFASAFFTIAWWPADLLVFRRVPQALHPIGADRAVAAASSLAVAFLQPRFRLFRAHPYLTLGSSPLLVCLASGYELGKIGGPSTPWFNFPMLLVLTPVVIALTLRQRILTTVLFALALVVGFFGLHPDHFEDPMAPATLSFLVFVVLLSVGSGIVADRIRRRTFLLRRAVERQAGELRDWNERLEGMVREQTEELRLLTAHRESTREEERAHIARELHDELGQELTAIRYSLELLRARYRQQPQAVAGNIDDLEGLVARTRGTIRNILTDLRPVVLDRLGFLEAARWLARRTEERAGFECLLDLPPSDLDVPEQVSIAGFRILQETLTNAARHARPRQVRICIRALEGGIELRVQDDGVGFDPRPQGKGFAGMGLVGMRERARDLGGTLAVESSPGKGTTIVAQLPVQLAPRVQA
jgi:signal transduction histidine kinase